MATPSFTITISGQPYQVTGLTCVQLQTSFASGFAHEGWALQSCAASPVNVNTNLVFAKAGQANRTVQISAISPLIPAAIPTQSTQSTASIAELQQIRQHLDAWLTPQFFNFIYAAVLLFLFWIGFSVGSRTTGKF
jgi:hypothetical protein